MSQPRSEHKLDLGPLPQANLNQLRSNAAVSGGSPVEVPGAGLRYPLGNGLAAVGSTGAVTRTGAGSPSKDYSGSRLFPKRYHIALSSNLDLPADHFDL